MADNHFKVVSTYPKRYSTKDAQTADEAKSFRCMRFEVDEVSMKLDQNYLYFPTFYIEHKKNYVSTALLHQVRRAHTLNHKDEQELDVHEITREKYYLVQGVQH